MLIAKTVFRDISSKCHHLVQQMKMICWLSGHRPQHRSCTANRTVQYLARSQSSVFVGGVHKNLGGGHLRSRDQTNSECGNDLVNILLQILCYPSLVWILPSNLEVKTKEIKKKVFIAKSKATCLRSLDLSCCFIEKSVCGYLVLGKSLLVVLLQKFTLAWGAQAVIWGKRLEMSSPVHKRSQDF